MHGYGRRHPGTDDAGTRRARQMRELVRLSNRLRADLGLPEVLTQLTAAVGDATGFNLAVFNLVQPGAEHLRVAAVAGLAAAEAQQLMDAPPRLQAVLLAMRDEFRLSHSYFISHEHPHALDAVESIIPVRSPAPSSGVRGSAAWHPDDTLLVPLLCARHDRLLGILSLDQPADGQVPTLETMEMVELFANQAATAIDLATQMADYERDRQALHEGIYRLLGHLGRIGQGQLTEQIDLTDTPLGPAGTSLNASVEHLRAVLLQVASASALASRGASDMQTTVRAVTLGAQRQAQDSVWAATTTARLATEAHQTVASSKEVLSIALEASAIAHEGRIAAEGAAVGMVRVRDRTLVTARKIKHLGEVTQQISDVVQSIAQFAEETQLLAVNAAIEATRAGDQGRGFAIVAQQIRDLATNSSEATRAISERIKALQQETSAIAVTIEESTREVVEQSDLAAVAGAALGAADGIGQRLTAGIGDLNQTAGQQAQTAAQVARTIDDVVRTTLNTSEAAEALRIAVEEVAGLVSAARRGLDDLRLEPEVSGAAHQLPVAAPPPLDEAAAPAVLPADTSASSPPQPAGPPAGAS